MMAMREIRVATMKEEEQREQEEDKTDTKTAVEKGIMAWKRARASSQRTSRTTKDGETDKKKSCQKVAAKMTMRIVMVVVVKAGRMIERALLNEVECRMTVLVDTCSFLLLLLRYLSLILRIA
ncbi:unnamed protein product [Ectocarpus sp. CCAP 1310/34]|nr:unnamed protein product [Ectocarpus sp. CCAP 1310/34]